MTDNPTRQELLEVIAKVAQLELRLEDMAALIRHLQRNEPEDQLWIE